MKRRTFLKGVGAGALAMMAPSFALASTEVGGKMIELNNGKKMPILGLGMWNLRDKECEEVVAMALEIGYRSFDSAQMYRNEAELGRAIKNASHINRDEIFITSKIVSSSYDDARAKIDESAKRIGSKIDLMLIHWPSGNNTEVYKALEDACNEGIISSCGLSNFYGDELDDIIKNARIMPVLNQCQTHIYQQNKELRVAMAKHNIYLESFSPFGGEKNVKEVLANETLVKIAAAHGKTPAQIVLAWLISENIIVIPKTSKKQRLKENFEVFDIALSKDEIASINALDKNQALSLW